MAELRRLLSAREPLYAGADYTVETSRLEPDDVLQTVAALVTSRPERRPRPPRTSDRVG
jgi:hypothetical protein